MSISNKLRTIFQLMETVAFIEWKDATPERKEEITKDLGATQGAMILHEISEQVDKHEKERMTL